MAWLLTATALLFLLAGTAIAYVIGASAVFSFVAADKARYLAALPQRVFSQVDVFSYMSMPLFILAGEIMNRAGITRALIQLSMALVGRLKGGLGHVNIMTSVFFAGISGSAIADSAALSNTLVPAMREQGYSSEYAGAITAASSIIGPIIPPSIILIFYGALMETSVGALFVAGVVPGLLLACALFAVNAVYAYKDGHPGGASADLPGLGPSFRHAAPSLLLPVIILGGIVGGMVTPTEAAALAVVTATLVGVHYGKFSLSSLRGALERTATLTGSIFVILTAVACLGYIASLQMLPQHLAELVTGAGLSGLQYLLLINLVFIAAGMVMDIPVAMALLVPLLAPPALAQGIDPVHLGIVICFNLSIGLITPPLGGCLLIVSTITKVGYWQLARTVIPFAIAEIGVLLCLIFFPELTLVLPKMLGFL